MMRLAWAALAPLLCLASNLPTGTVQYRAFWVDAYHAGYKNAAEVDQLVEDTLAANCNAIFLQVRRRADSYYLKTLEAPAQDPAYSPDFDALRYLTGRARARGIEVHAWFVVYPVWNASAGLPSNPEHLYYKHGRAARGRDMWMSVSSRGAVGWSLDPGHPDAQDYLVKVITDPLRHYDVDGIHLDYIRYAEEADYGWNPVSVERFRRLRNPELRGAPAAGDAAWAEFRREQVTALVRRIYLRAHEMKPEVKVSASVISWGRGPADDEEWKTTPAYRRVFQDWRAWMEEGILDLAVPMHYFREASDAALLDGWARFARERQYRRSYLPGIASYLNGIPHTLAQMRRLLSLAAEGAAPVGIGLYSYASSNRLMASGAPQSANRRFYRAAGEFFGIPARVPDLPWLSAPKAGHVAGELRISGGAEHLRDGIRVVITAEGKDWARSAVTDGNGFYGFVDVPPGRYRLRMERGGTVFHNAFLGEVTAGRVKRHDVVRTPAELPPAGPSIERVRAIGLGAYEIVARGVRGAERLRVFYNGVAADVLSVEGNAKRARLAVMIEPGVRGEFRIQAAGVLSAGFPF
jgi:uncharacterized lipoprotein YddW (UPF0748 family)